MKILFLSRWFPYPPDNGSKIRIYNLLEGISARHEITLISFYEPSQGTPDTGALGDFCKEIHVVPWRPFKPNSLQAWTGFFGPTPRSFIDTFSPELKEKIETAILNGSYDLVIASQIDMAAYVHHFHGTPAIFEEVEVGVLYEQFSLARSWLQRLRYGLTWGKYRRYLTSLVKAYRMCTAVSEREAKLLSQAVGDGVNIEIIPNFINLHAYAGVYEGPEPQTLIFTGSLTFDPNYQAMDWFLAKVYPQVVSKAPQVRLSITGNHANRIMPQAGRVILTGLVPDVRPLVARAWCSIVPIHKGGGTRLKILEAMALGTPVVTTSKGMEGLDLCPGEHVLVADDPTAFTEAIIRLFDEPGLRQRLAQNARRLLQEKYNWSVVMPRFLDLVERNSLVGLP